MPFMLSLACLQMKLSPAEALIAATINAAWSLDLGDRWALWTLASKPTF
jgi:imidazolonepropionase